MTTGPSFRFRLERIRALRERKQELARRELAGSMARLHSSEGRLRDTDARLEHAHAEQRFAAGEPAVVSAAELAARQAFVERIEGERSADALDVRRREAEAVERGADLGAAARELKMLERLKERHRAAHEREAERRQRAALDEIALDGFRRSVA